MEPWEIATAVSVLVLAGVGVLWLALWIAKDESETTVLIVDGPAAKSVAIGDVLYIASRGPDRDADEAFRSIGVVTQVNGQTITAVYADVPLLPVP